MSAIRETLTVTSQTPLPASIDDYTLIARIRQGDREAFAVLYRRHVRAVHGYAASLLRAHDDVEDLVQETFVTAWQRLDGDTIHVTTLDVMGFRAWPRNLIAAAWLHSLMLIGYIDALSSSPSGALFNPDPPKWHSPRQASFQQLMRHKLDGRWSFGQRSGANRSATQAHDGHSSTPAKSPTRW
jgi:hypothetical protein